MLRSILRLFAVSSSLLAGTIPVVVAANAVAQAAPQARIFTAAIDDSTRTPLAGTVPVAARSAIDRGTLAPAFPLQNLSLRFAPSAAQQAALDQLLVDQQNPASPRYRQWLTPEQFAAQFGLAPSDLAKVSSWLTLQGFTVTQVSRGGLFILFSGTVGQVQTAFHTQLHNVTVNGEQHYTNLDAPSLPASLALVTQTITGLHDFRAKPHHHAFSVLAPGATDASGLTPAYTSSTSGNHYIAPGDFYTIYDEKPLLSAGNTGTGITIGVMGQTDINIADINNFRNVSGLIANTPSIFVYGTDPGQLGGDDLIEAELDLEWSGATAPGANILYVNSYDVINGSLTQAIDQNLAPILTVSYGECEQFVGASALTSYNSLLQMANAQGQAVVAAAGDAGATDCDTSYPADYGLAVDFPASLPTIVGVGGTMFNEGTATYFRHNEQLERWVGKFLHTGSCVE